MLWYLEESLSSCQEGVRGTVWPEICILYFSHNRVLAPSDEQMKRDLQCQGQPAALNSQPMALWSHSKLLGQCRWHFTSIQSSSTISFWDLFRNQLSSPAPLQHTLAFFFFYQNAHLGSQCCSFFPPLTIFTPDRRYDLQSQAKSCAVTAPPARHRTTSTDNLVPPHSPPSKNTSISTHRQTSTLLSKCHQKDKNVKDQAKLPNHQDEQRSSITWLADRQFQLQISWLYPFPSM